MTPARILLIDDHAIFLSGVRMVLNQAFPHAEIFKAGSLDEAMKCAADKLDAILLDVKLPGMNGIEGMGLIKRRWPDTPVLVLSSHNESKIRDRALARGAAAFVSKAETVSGLAMATTLFAS
jgi:DNA-binding NarL/FixJ family response regulator